MSSIRAPKGFFFKISKPYPEEVLVELCESKTRLPIGSVSLVKNDNRTYETHSNLRDEYHNRGFGALMYSKAIQWCHRNGLRVRSSGCSSLAAQRVWLGKTIRKHFRIRTRRWPQEPDNCNFFIWYAFPK